jgi:hypothetical protein
MICMLLLPGSILSRKVSNISVPAHATAADPASVVISPANPLIEKDPKALYLNFDIIIKNTSKHTLYLATVAASVMDAYVKPVSKQSINVNAQTAGIKAIGNTLLKPGESVDIFNPFYSFAPDAKITFLQYEFFFDYADSPQQLANDKKRLPVDFDMSIKKIITPRTFASKTNFNLPVKGKLIVLDGHNFYPGQSNGPAGMIEHPTKGVTAKSNRYAFDLASVDDQGNMYATDPFKRDNWFVFGKPVYAPATGIVVEMQNDIPDNDFNGKTLKPYSTPATDPLGLGNYIIIDHGNGEFSVLSHLQKGSIIVRNSMLIRQGQPIAKVGFSGSATFPHLHYAIMNGSKETAAEGIPSYFADFKSYRGKNFVNVKNGRVDSGDIIESSK